MIINARTMWLSAVALLCLFPASGWSRERTVRIGYQKYGTLVLEKARGTLERRLAPLHVHVTWTEFLGGPALLEAMGADAIDFGITGDTPPIFAQAAGVKLVYVAVEPPSPHGEALIVPSGSPIHSIADLRGKRIALNKGSNVHNLLVRVLQSGGLTPADVECVFLKPSDARPAFENGSVDAWVIWDPYLAAAETALQTRQVADGKVGGKIIDENREFFLATRDFAGANPDVVHMIVADLTETEAFAAGHRDEVTQLLAPAMGMDPVAVKRAVDRLAFGVQPVDDKILAGQQDVADVFARLGLIPARIDLQEARPGKGS